MSDVTCSNCNSTIQVSNQSDSEILLAKVPTSPVPDGIPDSLEDGYDLALQALPASGSITKIATKATANIDLEIAPGKPTDADDLDVDLIAMRTDNLYPVKRMKEAPQSCGGDTTGKCQGHDCWFSDLTITTADQDAMKSSLAYYQSITAYPNTKESKKLLEIIKSFKDSKIDLEEVEKEINAFFTRLPAPYNACTFDSFATIISYTQNYAPIWADLKSTYTYQVYTPNDAKDPKAKPAWVKLGTITFTQSGQATLNDPTAGYNIVYASAQDSTKKTNLTIFNGQFVDKDNPVGSTIALQGLFQLKSDFTLNSDDNILLPALAGKLSNKTVLAIALEPPATPSDPGKPEAPWWNLVDATWANQLFKYLALVAAVAGFILLVYKFVKYVQSKTKKGLSEAEKKAFEERVAKAITKLVEKEVKMAEEIPPELEPIQPLSLDDDSESSFTDLNTESVKTKNRVRVEVGRSRARAIRDSANSLLKYGNNSNLQETFSKLHDASDDLYTVETNNYADPSNKLIEADQSLSGATIKVTQDFKSKSRSIGIDVQKTIQTQIDVAEVSENLEKVAQEAIKTVEEEEMPDVKIPER